jgi:antitoxin component of MazEF toxin-antitoxin module
MTLRRQVKRVGGSLGILIPRDVAAAIDVKEGSEVRLTVIGRQVVIEPSDDSADEGAFQRAMAAVLRRDAAGFEALAAFDRGEGPLRSK